MTLKRSLSLGVLSIVSVVAMMLIVMIFGISCDVFKSLCAMGHTFDAHYQVEIRTPDEIAEDFCAYIGASGTCSLRSTHFMSLCSITGRLFLERCRLHPWGHEDA